MQVLLDMVTDTKELNEKPDVGTINSEYVYFELAYSHISDIMNVAKTDRAQEE